MKKNYELKAIAGDGTFFVHFCLSLAKRKYELKAIVDPVIQRNGYFGHSENILIAMLTDERQPIRELGYRRILAARLEHSSSSKIRQFRVPVLNFDANDYIDLVSWQDIDRHDPPIMKNYSENQIRAFIDKADTNVIQLPHFPCPTQAAERCIKLVTEA